MARRPRARSLSRSREVVEIEERAMRAAVLVDDFPHAHVRVKHRDGAGDLLERDAEPPLGRPQRRRHHVVELEVRLDLRFVEIVFRLAHLLGEIEVVPGLDRDRRAPRGRRSPASRRLRTSRGRRPRATRAGETSAPFVGSAAIVSAMRQCAWLGNPSSLARSARSLTMAVIVTLVSFASPLSPRLLNFLHTISRRSRRGDDVRNGSTLDRVFTIARPPSTGVEVFSSASTLARNSANRAASSWLISDSRCFSAAFNLRATAHEVLVHARDEPYLVGLEMRSPAALRTRLQFA